MVIIRVERLAISCEMRWRRRSMALSSNWHRYALGFAVIRTKRFIDGQDESVCLRRFVMNYFEKFLTVL